MKHTDANGIASFFAYDMLDRETSSVRDLNGNGVADSDDISLTTYWTDPDPRWPSIYVDSHGNTTSFGYDSLGRTTSITNADGTRHSFIWSPRSNLIQETDANGTVITHSYDANDRCTTNQITPGAGVAATTTLETFRYDGSSRLVAAANDVSSCAFSYDSHDNLVSETRNSLTTSSTYDALGNRLSLTYPDGRALTYGYNTLDLCTNIFESSVSLVSFDYDAPDRLARISYGNGMRTRIFYDGISGVANPSGDFGHGQVRRIVHAMAGGSPQICEVNLKWDRNGNKLQRDDAIFQPAIPRTNSMVLDYDAADRLVQSVVVSNSVIVRDTVYGLDRMGNRTNVTGSAFCSGSYSLSATIPPGDYQVNQYTATPCDTRAYDENGNLISRSSSAGPTTYQHDFAGRLVSVQALDLNSGTLAPVSEYAYDALGRRIAKTVFSGAGGPPVVKEFFYDGDEVIEERENSVLISSLINKKDDGITIISDRSGNRYFHHTDDQGNVLALTTTGGAVAGRYDYDDYGLPIFLTSDGTPIATNASPTGNSFLFHGMEWDAETGFYHDGAANPGMVLYKAKAGKSGRAKQSLRYADPNTGRGIASADGNFSDNNPWSDGQNSSITDSDGRVVRKMIPITVPDISGNDRRVTVNGSGANSARVRQLRYTAKQGKTGSASGK